MVTANSINANTAGIVGYNGTGTFTGTAATNHAVIVGGSTSSTLGNVGPSATVGAPLISAGAAADPAFSTTFSITDSTGTALLTKAYAGAAVSCQIINTDNTSAISHSVISAVTGGSSGGNAVYTSIISGVFGGSFCWGIFNQANPSWRLSQGTDLSGTTLINVTQSGEITEPLQPAFLAYQASAANNVTGAGAGYTLGTTVDMTEVFDQNSDFNPTTGVFTSPVTGRYDLAMSAYINGTTIATVFSTNIVTSNQTFLTQIVRAAVASDQNAPNNVFCDMDAADTATFVVASSGEAADTDDVYGQAGSPR